MSQTRTRRYFSRLENSDIFQSPRMARNLALASGIVGILFVIPYAVLQGLDMMALPEGTGVLPYGVLGVLLGLTCFFCGALVGISLLRYLPKIWMWIGFLAAAAYGVLLASLLLGIQSGGQGVALFWLVVVLVFLIASLATLSCFEMQLETEQSLFAWLFWGVAMFLTFLILILAFQISLSLSAANAGTFFSSTSSITVSSITVSSISVSSLNAASASILSLNPLPTTMSFSQSLPFFTQPNSSLQTRDFYNFTSPPPFLSSKNSDLQSRAVPSINIGYFSSYEYIRGQTLSDGTASLAAGTLSGLERGVVNVLETNSLSAESIEGGQVTAALLQATRATIGNLTTTTTLNTTDVYATDVYASNTITTAHLQASDTIGTSSLGALSILGESIEGITMTAQTISAHSVVASTSMSSVQFESIQGTFQNVVVDGIQTAYIVAGFFLSDNTATLAQGSLTSALLVSSATTTDGAATLAQGSLTSALLVSSATLTDGTGSLAGGSLVCETSYASLASADVMIFSTLTDGTATFSDGSLTSLEFLQSSSMVTPQIQAANILATDLLVSTLTATSTTSVATLTDSVCSLSLGSLTSARLVSALTVTDGTASLSAATLSSLSLLGSLTISDGTAFLSEATLSSLLLLSSSTISDGTTSLSSGSLTNIAGLGFTSGVTIANKYTTSFPSYTFTPDGALGPTDCFVQGWNIGSGVPFANAYAYFILAGEPLPDGIVVSYGLYDGDGYLGATVKYCNYGSVPVTSGGGATIRASIEILSGGD